MSKTAFGILLAFLLIGTVIVYNNATSPKSLPLVAIANYGPHPSLEAAIKGLKNQLSKSGFVENETVRYKVADVGFDPALIPQMVTGLSGDSPAVLVAMSTPVAQFAKHKIHHIPLVYSAVTDPIEAGLLKKKHEPDGNMTGSSDQQDLEAFLKFAQKLLPNSKNIGILYATAEANDTALVRMMRASASKQAMQVVALPIEEPRDIPVRIKSLKGKVDFIYVGASGPIQPALPIIAAEAHRMHIPVFNMQAQAVKEGLALASFGVDYESVGENTGKLVIGVLNKKQIKDLSPLYPAPSKYRRIVNRKVAEYFGVQIPQHNKIEIVG